MKCEVRKALTKADQKKAFAIREEVFVGEQGVSAADEFDEFEEEAHHFVALDHEGNPIGSARWRMVPKGIKLERFTVKKTLRSQGLGSQLVETVLSDIAMEAKKNTYLYLHSQLAAVPLYEKFGFQKEGDQFDECGIMHYLMWKRL
ncbi:MAG: GNAT family N-acetyltransferase [Bacteroidota bacterium]